MTETEGQRHTEKERDLEREGDTHTEKKRERDTHTEKERWTQRRGETRDRWKRQAEAQGKDRAGDTGTDAHLQAERQKEAHRATQGQTD